jgi:prepilin-type N-terminal cleavage/methylation domain-containing protein
MVRARRESERGMTLVEIMITLIISSIVAASTFMFFAGQQRVYETQTKLLNIQQNLWAAMEVVARYVRAAGSGMYGCVRPASYANAALNNGSRLPSESPSEGPLSTSLATRPWTGIRAYDATAGAAQWIPPLWIVNNSSTDADVVVGTDVITVAFGVRTSGTDVDATLALNVASTDSTGVLSLTGVSAGDMFRRGEFVLLLVTPDWGYGTDPRVDRGCTLFQVTSDPTGAATLSHAASAINPDDVVWNPAANVPDMLPASGYAAGSAGVRNFGQLVWVTFFITRGANGIPNLMMQQRHLGGTAGQAQVLAEGIEDLQVSFACDTGILGTYDLTQLDGQLNEGSISDDTARRTDEWWNNVENDVLPAINTPGYCNLPTAVRVTLVARSLAPDDLIDPGAYGNGPKTVEDHRPTVYGSPIFDQYRRRSLSTTIYPRNNKPL